MKSKSPKEPGLRGVFTLIELLVVVTIIMILIAMLMPVLSRVRLRGKQVATASNMKQIAMGMLASAQDNKNLLPWFADDAGWLQRYKDDDFDWRPLANQYGFMSATSHPTMDAPAWDDSGNTTGNLNSNYAFRFGSTGYGNSSGDGKIGSKEAITPWKVNKATAGMCMFQEALRFNDDDIIILGVSNTGKGKRTYAWSKSERSGNSSALCRMYFIPNWIWSAKFDGSIQKIQYAQTVQKKKSGIQIYCDMEDLEEDL